MRHRQSYFPLSFCSSHFYRLWMACSPSLLSDSRARMYYSMTCQLNNVHNQSRYNMFPRHRLITHGRTLQSAHPTSRHSPRLSASTPSTHSTMTPASQYSPPLLSPHPSPFFPSSPIRPSRSSHLPIQTELSSHTASPQSRGRATASSQLAPSLASPT